MEIQKSPYAYPRSSNIMSNSMKICALLQSNNFEGFNNKTIDLFDWDDIELAPGVYVPDYPSVPSDGDMVATVLLLSESYRQFVPVAPASGDYNKYFKLWVIQAIVELTSENGSIDFPLLRSDMVDVQPIHSLSSRSKKTYSNSKKLTKREQEMANIFPFGKKDPPLDNDSSGKGTAYSRWLEKEEQRELERNRLPSIPSTSVVGANYSRRMEQEAIVSQRSRPPSIPSTSVVSANYNRRMEQEEAILYQRCRPPSIPSTSVVGANYSCMEQEEAIVSQRNRPPSIPSTSVVSANYSRRMEQEAIVSQTNNPPPYTTLNGTFKRWMVDDDATVPKKKTPLYNPSTSTANVNYDRMEQEDAIVSQSGTRTKEVIKVKFLKPTGTYNPKPHK